MDAKEVKELQEVRKEIISNIDNILRCLDKIQAVEEGTVKAEKPKKAPNGKQLFDPTPKKEEAPNPELKQTPTLTLADVKKVLMEKAKAGFDQEVHALIKSYDVEKLSAVPEDKYANLLKKAKEIGNG
ncbi:hypothetical protein [Butyrivibrio proteoclasticus]|uniref:hypothetical protein n=1 Tax=Butyrivibrio proteoclasticus TaxID=43305 RepID=UPI000557F2D6|nr:hypothetical protein [Butyrivibrio proteoclasticus]